jgi:uncharacterized protein YdcH (DUF465 family)
MQLDKHTLVNDFPEHQHTIRHLKMNDRHFSKLSDEYHKIDRKVHHIEEGNEPVSDEYLDALKVRRVHLKDELFNLIQKTEMAL